MSAGSQNLMKPASEMLHRLRLHRSAGDESLYFDRYERAVKFYIGPSCDPGMNGKTTICALQDFASQLAQFDLLKLPFETCLFQFGPIEGALLPEGSGTGYWIVLAWQEERLICGRLYSCHWGGGKWSGRTGFGTFRIPSGLALAALRDCDVGDVWEKDGRSLAEAVCSDADDGRRIFLGCLFYSLGLLGSNGAETHEVASPFRLNKRRAAKGKPPIYGCHVVTVDVRRLNVPGAALGEGDRAAPRLHWRRGHVRKLQDGRITTVRPCLVGFQESEQSIPRPATYRAGARVISL